jgi:hypothetical protein
MTDSVAGTVWADWEVDVIVADYFEMLKRNLSGQPFVKAARNEALQQIIPRSRKSIEFKHCNISAVLMKLGIKPLPGYAPLANYQNALIDGVERYLAQQGEPIFSAASEVSSKVAEAASLWIGQPPSAPAGEEKETEALRRLVRKFDPAERDARNRALGKQGEELVLERERAHLLAHGRKDLEQKLEWTSQVRGDGAGYDIRSFELDGKERLIEVKTTNGPALTPFFLSENERAFSEERPDVFRLMRVHDFREKPAAFQLMPPLDQWVKLMPANYRASFPPA